MTKLRWFITAIETGTSCAVVFIATGLLLRLGGVPTLAELFSDRLAPMLGIPLFFKMLNTFGGYSHVKQIGYLSVLLGEVVAFIVVSFIAARSANSNPSRVRRIVPALAAILCVVCLGALWPVLATNYLGIIPRWAIVVNALSIAAQCAIAAWFLIWMLPSWTASREDAPPDSRRRRLLSTGFAALAGTASAGILIRFFGISAYTYDGSVNVGEDLPPITPNDRFYAVTKNNVDPRPDASVWRLRITGKVSQPKTLRLDEIKAMPALLSEVTLQCISNPVGGGLNSNAVWKGVRLKDVLAACGVSPSATQASFHGADGFIDDVPFTKAIDPDTLLVYEMNGQPLSFEHGFPARLIVPGYVGEKSVKWVTEIEVLDHAEKGFYEQQGWGPQFTLNNTARFDSPDFTKPIAAGSVVRLKGTAFAGDRGVSQVQVSTDGEKTWREAEISYRSAKTAWVQWRLLWKPAKAGDLMLSVRCVDNDGQMESGETKTSAPEPATGYHRVKAMIKA